MKKIIFIVVLAAFSGCDRRHYVVQGVEVDGKTLAAMKFCQEIEQVFTGFHYYNLERVDGYDDYEIHCADKP